MVTPRSLASVKSDRPWLPGGCSWRKITSRSGPCSACQCADAALQRAADAFVQLAMAAQHLLEHGDGPQAGRRLQHRHDLGVPDRRQRIGPPAAARRSAAAREAGDRHRAGAGAGAETRAGGGESAGCGSYEVHVKSRLLVGDVRAGHEAIPRKGNRTLRHKPHATAGRPLIGSRPCRG